MRQRKVRTVKQRSKHTSCSNISQEIEENDTTAAENPGDERTIDTVEKDSEQKEITRVDRRWEFELLSRMREKLLNKAEKSMKSTRKRVVWGCNYFPTVALYIIRLYASSAFRFAALKSNRSYIPGD